MGDKVHRSNYLRFDPKSSSTVNILHQEICIVYIIHRGGQELTCCQFRASLISETPGHPVDTSMSAPKGSPKARQILIPPLISTTEGGEPYQRRADVEDSIAQVLEQPLSEWITAFQWIYLWRGVCGIAITIFRMVLCRPGISPSWRRT